MQTFLLKRKHLLICLTALFLLLPLTGCTKNDLYTSLGFGSKSGDSVESLAMRGLDYYDRGKYGKAKESFETLLNTYPFSEYSLLAELKSADSSYYLEEYEEAVLKYMDFEERHPTNEAIPYVMFQVAMCYYKQIDTIDRDVSNAVNGIYSFSRLLRAFPNSPYEDEAEARVKAARNFLANHEYYVASYYERTGAYEEAKARLNYLLKQYPEAKITPTAEMLLYDIRNDQAPGRTWLGWLGQKLPDWEDTSPEKQQ